MLPGFQGRMTILLNQISLTIQSALTVHGFWQEKGASREFGDIIPLKYIGFWLWAYYNKIPIYPIFYLRKANYNPNIYPIIMW